MLRWKLPRRPRTLQARLGKMASHFANAEDSQAAAFSLADLPKSSVFTDKLPPDTYFDMPLKSHNSPREALGPRIVRGAMYTFVRPEPADEPELLGVSPKAMEDIGLRKGEEQTPEFKAMVAGNKIFWDEQNGGVYPWAQCYGGEIG